MLNKYLAIGNLTQDPVIKEFGNDKKVCNFSMAINASKNSEPFFVEIQTWDRNADKCIKFLNKGSRVFIEGRLKTSKWEDKTGQTRSKTFCTADVVQFLGGNNADVVNNNKKEAQPKQDAELSDADLSELQDIPF